MLNNFLISIFSSHMFEYNVASSRKMQYFLTNLFSLKNFYKLVMFLFTAILWAYHCKLLCLLEQVVLSDLSSEYKLELVMALNHLRSWLS